MSRALSVAIVAVVLGLALPAASQAQTHQQGGTRGTKATSIPVLSPALAATRAALDRYQDPIAAVHDGYFSTLGCIEYPTGSMEGHGNMAYKPGGMGVHFLNPALIGPTLDSLKPQVLIYEPSGGKLRLVAAEWFVPTQVSKEAPVIFGQTLQGPMEGHEPVLPVQLHHWDLHVWLWKANPNGVFSATNPKVVCGSKGYSYSFDERPPKMVSP
jgi:hypothetical protein